MYNMDNEDKNYLFHYQIFIQLTLALYCFLSSLISSSFESTLALTASMSAFCAFTAAALCFTGGDFWIVNEIKNYLTNNSLVSLVGFNDAFNTIRLYKHPAKGVYRQLSY